jgi:hypothetical protein
MKVRFLLPAAALFALLAAAPSASAQCGNPTCAFQTFNIAPNVPLLTVLNCPTIGNPGFHIHMNPLPVGVTAVPLFFATATTGAAGIPITLGATTYNILIDPTALLAVIPAGLEAGSATHWNIQPSIPNDPSLLGGFLAVQAAYILGLNITLLNRISFTICS